MKKLACILCLGVFLFASCKKTASTTSTSSSTPPATTSTTYSLSFLDGSTTTYTLNATIQLALTSYPTNANTEFGTWIKIPGNSNNSGYIYLATPLDSSNMYKLAINTNYSIHYFTCYTGQTIPDSDIGSLSFLMSTPSGTDSTVSQTLTTTYYNKITSVTYIGRKYDSVNLLMSPQYVVKGTFNAQVKNNVTGLTRVFSNGQYSIVIGCRAH